MNLKELRVKLKSEFANNNIETIDVDFIISEVLNLKRNELIFVNEVSESQSKQIEKYAQERMKHIPIDKLFNKAYFYGLEFYVDEDVLTPRPESENLVELALSHIENEHYKSVLDLCCGSGCLGIAIAKNSNTIVDSADVSEKALEVSKINMKKNNVSLNLIHSDMFDNIKNKYDVIVSNPPYIASEEIDKLDKEVKFHDPILALDGGVDGLVFYKQIHDNLINHLNDDGILIMEIGNEQKHDIIKIFSDMKLVDDLKDYAENDRVLSFKLK